MKENYKILGISENATDEEVKAAYESLRAKYKEERFLEGERGNEAARQLTKVETAYAEITSVRKQKIDAERNEYDFSEVESLIKAGKISEAQQKLDDFNDRNAEWHYLQSVIFYKKNWTNESKKQLEISMNMEPTNAKYSDAYRKLKEKIEFTEKQFRSGNADFSGEQGRTTETQMGGGFMDFCTTLCCMNLCLNCCCNCH